MPFKIFENETIESFLLRLTHYQGYDSFQAFSKNLEHQLCFSKGVMAGVLPKELGHFNLHRGQITTQKKVQALWLIESELHIEGLDLLKLSLKNSSSTFSPAHVSVTQNENQYPKALIRNDHTPICPECLRTDEYIRQNWQFHPYQACHIHQCNLLHHCPECSVILDYRTTESIALCQCGYDLRTTLTSRANQNDYQVSRWIIGDSDETLGLANLMDISARYGFLHWYINRYKTQENLDLESFRSYCLKWPDNLYKELESQIQLAEVTRVNEWISTSFNYVFGDLLVSCRQLPYRHTTKNIVLQFVVKFFEQKVKSLSNKKQASFTSILLSPLEAAALLSCSIEEIYQLYRLGKIKMAFKPTFRTKLHAYQAAFTLESVVFLSLTRKYSEVEKLETYLPSW